MTDSKGYSEFVALAGQGKAILTVCRGASHFNFHFLKCFSYIPTRKWRQKIIFIGRLAHTFAAVSRWTTLSVRVEFWILFPLESKCILIHDSRHVQPYDQKTYLGWELHKFHVQSSLQVKNYIMLLASIRYFSFKFQSTEISILATLCTP